MDPNFSRKNIFMYHDNPSEGPLIVTTVRYIEKHCNANLSHIKVREVQYAKPLLILVCPIVNKTDQDVNALLDSSRDGDDVMVVIVKRALERAKHKDSLAHLSDLLSTSTRNRVGAACTLYFSGREKFKGYKHENNMAIHEIKRVIGSALDNKSWATSFPVVKDGDNVDGTSSSPQSDSRQLQFVQTSAQAQDPKPIQVVNSSPSQQRHQIVQQTQPVQQSQPIQQIQPVQKSQPINLSLPPPTNRPIPQINIIPPSQPEPVADPFLAPVAKPASDTAQSQGFDDNFFDPRGEFNKPASDPFGDAFGPPTEEKEISTEILHFPKPTSAPKKIRGAVFYFFDDTSPLQEDTIKFIQEQGKFQLKACRRQTAAIVSPLIVFSPCYTTPDGDATSVLGQCRDGEDVYLVVIEPVYSHSNKQKASLSAEVVEKVGCYGVLSYSLDTKTFDVTDENSAMISNMKDFILERQALDPPDDDDDDDDEDDDDEDESTNVLILDGFQGFDESEA